MSIYDKFAREQVGTPRQEPAAYRPPATPQTPTYQTQQPGQQMSGQGDAFSQAFQAGDAAGGDRTRALMNAATCPSCGDPQYMASPKANAAAHCFACGYSSRFDNTLSAN